MAKFGLSGLKPNSKINNRRNAFAFCGGFSWENAVKDNISIEADFRAAVRQLDNIGKRQVPFAAKNALNKLAVKVIEDEQDEMRSVFDRPTPWTVNSLFVRNYATKQDLSVTIDFKDGSKGRSAAKYLTAQIQGGSRRTKAVENFFVRNGLMPAGSRIVPADNLTLDRYGNISLSAFRAMVRGVAAGTHFILMQRRGKLAAGLYKRGSLNQVRALLIYVTATDYAKRLRYFETAAQTAATIRCKSSKPSLLTHLQRRGRYFLGAWYLG